VDDDYQRGEEIVQLEARARMGKFMVTITARLIARKFHRIVQVASRKLQPMVMWRRYPQRDRMTAGIQIPVNPSMVKSIMTTWRRYRQRDRMTAGLQVTVNPSMVKSMVTM
jgi:hypothetical protein